MFREPGFVSEAKRSQSAELGVSSLGGKEESPRGASQEALVATNHLSMQVKEVWV